jgi:FkbM family methyltransferase
LAHIAIEGHVYALEPNPELFKYLEENIRDNALTNVSPIRAAASKSVRTLPFTANKLNRGDNRVTRNAALDVERMRAVTLDEAIGGSRLDLLKIDVPGFEVEVLLGAQQTLENDSRLIVAFEFWPYGLRQAGHEPMELLNLLRAAGFSIAALSSQGKLTAISRKVLNWTRKTQYCNLIASREGN